MDRRQIGMKLMVEGLGLQVRIDTFEERLVLQKAVYLAQASGVDLGYFFRWYLRGPYCPGLARDAFAVAAEIQEGTDDSEAWELDEKSQERLGRIAELFSGPDSSELARRAELLASVHFLIDRHQVSGRAVGPIMDALRRFGKDCTEPEVHAVLGELEDHGLLARRRS